MTKQQKQIIIVVVLLVSGAVIFWWRMRPDADTRKIQENFAKQAEMQQAQKTAAQGQTAPPATPGAPPPPATADSALLQSQVDIDELLTSVKEVDFDYDADGASERRNPMRPLVGSGAPTRVTGEEGDGGPMIAPFVAEGLARGMSVTGIVWDKHSPVAIVDNEVVSRGYVFSSGAIVEEIEPSRVLLRVNESLIPVELEEQ